VHTVARLGDPDAEACGPERSRKFSQGGRADGICELEASFTNYVTETIYFLVIHSKAFAIKAHLGK
jgi:hypothetical protein